VVSSIIMGELFSIAVAFNLQFYGVSLMTITSSFLKNRIIDLIIGFAVLCFLVGAVKDVFGEVVASIPDDAECYQWFGFGEAIINTGYPHKVSIDFKVDGKSLTNSGETDYILPFKSQNIIGVYYSPGGTNSKFIGTIACGYMYTTDSDPVELEGWDAFQEFQYMGGCSKLCDQQKQDKITECGGDEYVDWSSWFDDTCSGGTCLAERERKYGPPPPPPACN